MRHIKFCCRVMLGHDENRTNEILQNIRNMDERLCLMERRYLCEQGFPVISEGIKTKTQFNKPTHDKQHWLCHTILSSVYATMR